MAKRRKNVSRRNRIVFRMGKRIYLRPIIEEDVPHITVWINDPEVTQFLKVSLPLTPYGEKMWYEKLSERKEDAVFAIVLEKTNEIIGMMGLHRINNRDGTANTGSFIGRKDLWSQGYGTEAKMLVLEYAFNTLNLRKICSSVYDFNPRSKKCLEKCGYKEEGRRKEQNFRNGRLTDEILMAVFRKDFEQVWEKYRKEFLGHVAKKRGA